MLAAGSRPNFFHTPGAEQHAFPLYTVDDAKALRTRLIEVFEGADADPARIDEGALNIVIVGAGPTGVETAGAVADLVNDVIPKAFHDLDAKRPASTSSTTVRSCSPRSPTRPTPTRRTSSSTCGVILRWRPGSARSRPTGSG